MIDRLLYESLVNFYDDEYNKNKLKDILLSNDNKISLRSIDWFITNYSKKNNIFYTTYYNKTINSYDFHKQGDDDITKNVNVYLSYKSQLKAYSKKKFDPFCRRDRITFDIDDDIVETTIGQLNFFKWAIENMIIEYVIKNKKDIEKDMNNSLKISKNSHKKNDERKKRQELSLSATRGLSRTNVAIRLDFD
tara:strand:+ start:1034 stop:1609 length:576 start_codon:yes stop_codon:yes gene_type:complete